MANEEDAFDISEVWIVSGPIFYTDRSVKRVNGTGIPHATYKVIAWASSDNTPKVRGYIIPQDATHTSLDEYLTSIDQIENATGFNFFSDLPDPTEDIIEADVAATIWE